jgi:type VI secretion system protein ImpL
MIRQSWNGGGPAAILLAIEVIPLLWACLIVLLIMLLLLIVFLLWKAKRAASPEHSINDDQKETDSSAKEGDSNIVVAELSGSFSGAMRTLRSRIPGRDFRYSVPWFLLLGLPDSGKSSLLSESSLAMSLEEQVEVENGTGIAWNFFGDGIVIDVGGWCFKTDAATVGAWRRLLRLFINHRPERPLDGIILAIAATDLVGPTALSPTALIERGTLLQQRLRKLTQTIGFHLPIYVVVTKGDAIRGFSEFTSELDSDQLEQIFGWSTPYGDTHLFQPEWIDEAVDSIRITLERVQSRLFALHEPTPDRQLMFLFPGSFYSITPSLRLLLSRTMRSSGDTPAPMFRGLYFCGSTQQSIKPVPKKMELVPVSQPVRGTSHDFSRYDQENSGLSWVPNLLEPWLRSNLRIAFVHDVFFRKVFPERGLAVPLSHFFAVRDRMRIALQIVCCSLALFLALGTGFAYRRLSQEQNRLVPFLSRIEVDIQRKPDFALGNSTAADHPGADDLVHAMAAFNATGFQSVFLPASRISDLNHQIQQVIGHSFRILVLQRFHQGLELRSRQLADLNRSPTPNASLPPADPNTPPTMTLERLPEYLQMREFVRQITELDNNIALYNTLSRRNSDVPLQAIVSLDGYLHHRSQQVPINETADEYFKEAIRTAEWPPFIYSDPIRLQISGKAQQLTAALYTAWIEHNPTRTSTEALVSSIANLGTSGTHSYQELLEVKHNFDRAQQSYEDPQLQWVGADQIQLPNALAAVTTQGAGNSPFFPPWLHDWMLDLADADFRRLATSLDDAQTPLTANVIDATNGKLELSERSQDMQTAIENLLSLPFMSETSRSINLIEPGNRQIVWNKASLNAAAMLPASYERYLSEDLEQAPSELRNTLSHIAANQLTHALQIAIVEAEQPANTATSSTAQAQAFNDVAPSISTLLASLQQYSLSIPLMQLRQISTAQASTILSAIDQDLDNSEPYGFSTSVFGRWNGEQSATSQLFDAPTPDAITAYLVTQREEIESLNAEAAPLARFLSSYRSSLPPASLRTLNRWEDIGTALSQYQAKKPGNTVQLLESFITTDADKVLPANGCIREKSSNGLSKRPDYFTLAVTRLRQGIYLRCHALLSETFETTYSRLSVRFNHDLAGRFPFAPLSTSSLNDADPQAISDFYRPVDTSSDFLSIGMKGSTVTAANGNFIAMLRDTRPWFSSLLTTASSGETASLDVIPQFRVNREEENGGNQIIDWSLQIGNNAVHSGDQATKMHWSYGDTVSLTLRWAKNSPFLPTNIPVATNKQSMQVNGDTVSWTFKGGWSLVRLIQTLTHFDGANATGKGSVLDQPFVLTLNIPETSSTAAGSSQSQIITSARAFIRLLVSPPGAKETVTMDNFPSLAPPLPSAKLEQAKGQ